VTAPGGRTWAGGRSATRAGLAREDPGRAASRSSAAVAGWGGPQLTTSEIACGLPSISTAVTNCSLYAAGHAVEGVRQPSYQSKREWVPRGRTHGTAAKYHGGSWRSLPRPGPCPGHRRRRLALRSAFPAPRTDRQPILAWGVRGGVVHRLPSSDRCRSGIGAVPAHAGPPPRPCVSA